MKKIYFKLSQNARDFMSLCTNNNIQYNLPKSKGLLMCIEIPDTFENISFLSTNGYNID